MSESVFDKGLKLDVTKHIEKKGQFSYLSWPFAVQELRKLDPKATWYIGSEFKEEPVPYIQSEAGCFVEVTVILGDETRYTQIHPVLDNYNKTIAKPNAFQINTSIQRCLVKAIALASGIGLHIYAGEDLPPSDNDEQKTEKQPLRNWVEEIKTAGTVDRLKVIYAEAYASTDGKDRAEVTREKDKRKQYLSGPSPDEDQNI